MSAFLGWADLPPDLVRSIGDIVDPECYASARGGCTAWRCALVPCPSLLVVQAGDYLTSSTSAASIPTPRRTFKLRTIPYDSHCVGSSSGWLALSGPNFGGQSTISLFNPTTAAKIALPPLFLDSSTMRVSKIVLAPSHLAAATICGKNMDRLAYVTAGAERWDVLDPVTLTHKDHLTDLVYHEGSVYCLTSKGDVHVLLLPELNAPANVEHLLSIPFDPATSFAPPYIKISEITSAKNLVFCGGNLYQIWRNASCAMTMQLPEGGGPRRIEKNEVFVLRYYPDHQPCWDAVADLGGYSVFVGRNNAVSMYAQDVPGLKGNCVYWIGGSGGDQGMVFDMATGRSTLCLATEVVAPQITVCWYFLGG